MSRARWVGERTVDTVTVPVPVQVDLREATIEADIRSPGLSRPMRRTYTYIHTPDAAAAWGAEIAEEVHEENLESRLKVERAFEDAEAEQKRIENKRRARECAARNNEQTDRSMARRASQRRVMPVQRPRARALHLCTHRCRAKLCMIACVSRVRRILPWRSGCDWRESAQPVCESLCCESHCMDRHRVRASVSEFDNFHMKYYLRPVEHYEFVWRALEVA